MNDRQPGASAWATLSREPGPERGVEHDVRERGGGTAAVGLGARACPRAQPAAVAAVAIAPPRRPGP